MKKILSLALVLLMLLGIFDLLFYNGDILFIYAVCGLLVIPLIRASDKVIWFCIILMLIQPVELIYFIHGLIDPSTMPLNLGSGKYYGAMIVAQSEGNIFDVAVAGLKYGLPAPKPGKTSRYIENSPKNLLTFSKNCV